MQVSSLRPRSQCMPGCPICPAPNRVERWQKVAFLSALLATAGAAHLHGAWQYSFAQFMYLEDQSLRATDGGALFWDVVEPALQRTNVFEPWFRTGRFVAIITLLALCTTIFAAIKWRLAFRGTGIR